MAPWRSSLRSAFISWLVTRWRLDGDDLQIETGLIRRHSERYPLSQLQAIDVVRPGLARMIGVAELRLRMGGTTGAHARLAYLSERDAEPLRAQLLDLARQAQAARRRRTPSTRGRRAGRRAPRRPRCRRGRLIVSILISDAGFLAELVAVALIVTAAVSTHAAVATISFAGVWIFGAAQLVWAPVQPGIPLLGGGHARRAPAPRRARRAHHRDDPARARSRPCGWSSRSSGGRSAGAGSRSTSPASSGARARGARPAAGCARCCRSGRCPLADELLDRLVPDRPRTLAPPPARVRWKSPLRYGKLGWGRTETCVMTRSGRLRRVTCWVPLGKVQSFREVQGPVQRRLRLASVHLDTAGGNVHAILRDRDAAEADRVLVELVDLARAARAVA